MIRDNGTIIAEVYDEIKQNREYWLWEINENGMWKKEKIWETNKWKYELWIDFNQYGLVVAGELYSPKNHYADEIVVIKDDGEVEEISASLFGEYRFGDNGYLLSNRIYIPEESVDDGDNRQTYYLADSVSLYDYDGNLIDTYQLIDRDMLENGWYLKKLLYNEGKITGFYIQEESEELYIGQVQVEAELK